MTKPKKELCGGWSFFRDVSRGTGATSPLKKGIKKGKQRKREITPHPQKKNGGASVFLGTCVDAQQRQTRTKKETKENENMNARNFPLKKTMCMLASFCGCWRSVFQIFSQSKSKKTTMENQREHSRNSEKTKEKRESTERATRANIEVLLCVPLCFLIGYPCFLMDPPHYCMGFP